jgi:AAA+ ATPase superfamily predicted ATPase
MGNPFDSPTTIRDPRKLVGRDEHLKRIFDLLKNQQNVSIVGAKRIGKTSLLTSLKDEEMQRRFGFPGKDFLFLSIDLQERSLKTHKNFFDDINPLIRQQGHSYLQGVPQEEVEDDEFVNLLSALKQQGLHPVLMIDTFDLITRYKQADIDFFGFLRSQGNIGQVSYVTASIKTVGKICPGDKDNLGSPFFNIFRNVQLGPLSEKEARDLLIGFSAAEGVPFTDKEVSWVLAIAGCHPYFLQQVGAALFQEKSTCNAEKINLQRIKKEVYQDLEAYFIDYWDLLDRDERKQLAKETLQNERKDNKYPELNSSELSARDL